MNETVLVSRVVLLGDRDAFGRLVEAYQSPVRRFLLNLTGGDEELSKDLAQETFIKAWLHINTFRSAARFSTWLYRIAYNTFYDYLRTAKQMAGMGAEREMKHLAEDAPHSDFNIDFARALELLREEERVVMLLFYMEDQTVEKIARITGLPTGTVKSHLSRGREKLANYLF